jgi:Tol biopolymer transport system component
VSIPQRPAVAAPPLDRPQLLLTRARPGYPPEDLVLKTFGVPDLKVLVGGGHGVQPSFSGSGAWSPDGAKVAFTASLGEGRGERFVYERTAIYLINADGSGLRRLSSGTDSFAPIWSPDGRYIAFTRVAHPGQRPFTASLWIVRSDGGDERPLTPIVEEQIEVTGAFSPDGSLLAFTRAEVVPPMPNGFQPNTAAVYLLHLDGSGETKVADRSADPAFSPDGRRIVLDSDRDDNGTLTTGSDEFGPASEIYTVDLDGSRPQRLTRTRDIHERLPSFSPDGARIAYQRERDRFQHSVFEMNADGRCKTPIARARSILVDYSAPAWRPGRARSGGGPIRCEGGRR